MANLEHLELLLHDVETWNEWRTENEIIRPDLSNADLSNANLSSANLTYADLRHTNLAFSDLSYCKLNNSKLNYANLSGAFLHYVELNRANVSDATLMEAKIIHSLINDSHFIRANLNNATIQRANLQHSNLSEIQLKNGVLSNSDLRHTNLSGAHFDNSDLSYNIFHKTILGNINLRGVRGLETISHHGPSIVDIDTLFRSEGQIPLIFLRGVGIPEQFITYMRSLTQQPIQYFTCFISFSAADQSFVERLHTDLQAHGVRCWYFPDDMKTGDHIYEKIDESIRLYDKLVLILSHSSIASEWVEREVDIALAKEKETRQRVLFPIRLDDSILTANRYWTHAILENRNIGDFSSWKDFDSYQKAFARVLRDLQAPI